MGSSPNTAILPSIPLSRRVISDTEEHLRQVLDNYAEGKDKGTNTSPVQSSDEQQDETKTTSKGQKPVVTQAEWQEETLQLESPETEDTSIKQADPTNIQAQDIEEMRYQLQKILVNSSHKLQVQILRWTTRSRYT